MKNLVLWIGALLILLGIAVLAFVFLRQEAGPQSQPQNPGTYFPGAGSSDVVDRPILLASGERVLVHDFVDNGVTFEDPMNEGSYYLAGSLDYCSGDPACPSTDTPEFSILYLEGGQSFIVSLNEEPLGESREKAEQYLMRVLGVTQQTMCELSYTVGTAYSVNETYGSITQLGFSFCPGSVQLP